MGGRAGTGTLEGDRQRKIRKGSHIILPRRGYHKGKRVRQGVFDSSAAHKRIRPREDKRGRKESSGVRGGVLASSEDEVGAEEVGVHK